MGITTVALLAMQTVTAFASVGSYSQAKLGSITITPGDQDHKGAAVDADEAGTYTLYRVGDVVEGSSVTEFTLAKDFAGSGVTIDRESLNSAELPKTLAKYAEDHSIAALKDDITSGEKVGDLEIGLYLVKQKTVHVAWHSFSPFLVIMPEAVEGGYEYEVKAMPKTWKLSTAKLDPPVRKVITDQYGNSHTLSEYQGKVVFLNFWATWCGPCKSEMPEIQQLYEKYGLNEEDLVVLGVANPVTEEAPGNADKSREEIEAFLEENGYTFPVVMDETGQVLANYGISAFPTTFMIDAEGNLFGYVTGAINLEIMENIVEQTMTGQRK